MEITFVWIEELYSKLQAKATQHCNCLFYLYILTFSNNKPEEIVTE